jgi:hypothetical protein
MFAGSFQRFPSAFLRRHVDDMAMGHVAGPGLPEGFRRFPEASRRAGIFHDKQAKHSAYGRCGDCAYLGVCSVCPVSIANVPGNRDPHRIPDFACAYNLVALRNRDRFWEDLNAATLSVFAPEEPEPMLRLRAVAAGLRAGRAERNAAVPT